MGDPVGGVDPKGLCVSASAPAYEKIAFGVCKDQESAWLGIKDMWNAYREMKKANTKKSDKYFHCLSNCRASNRGYGGKIAAQQISDFREWYQEAFDGLEACEEDQKANRQGREGGNCAETCKMFKPSWLPKWVEQ